VGPRLAEWLTHVFIVLGGCAVATGALTVTLAATSFRAHGRGPAIGGAIGGAASIGLMTPSISPSARISSGSFSASRFYGRAALVCFGSK
jgi:hypothetical protein